MARYVERAKGKGMSMKRASSRLLLGLLGVATSAGLVLGGKAVVDSVAKGAAEVGAAAEGDKYVKVTENLTDWSGDYLIVWEEGNAAFDGSLTKLDASEDYISVTISNDSIEWTAEIAKSQFTIDAIDGGYSIKSASGYYVYQTSDANGLKSSTTTTGTNAISLGSDGISVVSPLRMTFAVGAVKRESLSIFRFAFISIAMPKARFALNITTNRYCDRGAPE